MLELLWYEINGSQLTVLDNEILILALFPKKTKVIQLPFLITFLVNWTLSTKFFREEVILFCNIFCEVQWLIENTEPMSDLLGKKEKTKSLAGGIVLA